MSIPEKSLMKANRRWLVSLQKDDRAIVECTQHAWRSELTPPTTPRRPRASSTLRECCRGARHDETNQDKRHSEEKEGNRVDNNFEVAHVIGVGDASDDLYELSVLPSNPNTKLHFSRLHATIHGRCVSHCTPAKLFLNALIASEEFDSSHQPTRPLIACSTQRTAKSIQSNWMASIKIASQNMIGNCPQKCFKTQSTCHKESKAKALTQNGHAQHHTPARHQHSLTRSPTIQINAQTNTPQTVRAHNPLCWTNL